MEKLSEVLTSASSLRLQRQFPQAIELFTDFIAKCESGNCSQQDLATAYNERGFTKYLSVDFDGAVQDYTKAIELSEVAVFYYNRGLVHYRLARFQDAVSDTTRALQLRPDFPDAQQCRNQAIIDGKLQ